MNSWWASCCSQAAPGDTEKIKGHPAAVKSDIAKPVKPQSTADSAAQPKDDGVVKATFSSPASASQGDGKAGRGTGTPYVATPSTASGDAGSSKVPSRSASPSVAKVQQDEDTMSVVSMESQKSIRSVGTTSSMASEMINSRLNARAEIQQEMKKFVRQVVRGQQMGVVSPDGQLRTCTFSLDKRLKHFAIELKGQERKIPLTSVLEVYQGNEPEDIETPLDELCSTVTLEQGGAITFHFDDIASRKNFAMCLQLLVDGQQQ